MTIEAAVVSYIAAWNERDVERRASLLALAVTEDIRIAIGRREVVGRAALDAEIVALHQAVPDARGRLSTRLDVQENVCRFAAIVESADGTVIAEMFDACACDVSGRIRSIISFVGAALPA